MLKTYRKNIQVVALFTVWYQSCQNYYLWQGSCGMRYLLLRSFGRHAVTAAMETVGGTIDVLRELKCLQTFVQEAVGGTGCC